MYYKGDDVTNITCSCLLEQVDMRNIKFYYMEDDGGSAMVSVVHPDIKTVLRKAVLHLEKAHGTKPQKVICYVC